MDGVDQVRIRPGGRSADVRTRVVAAVREALETGDPDALAVEKLAARSGVHRATIYRRWLSTEGLLADLLAGLTPLDTPLPDTGSLRTDLTQVVKRVADTITTPAAHTMLRVIAGSTDESLATAARAYWASILDHTAEVVRRAQQRGEATTDIDAVAAIEALLGPLYMRLLVTHQPLTRGFRRTLVTHTLRILQPQPGTALT